MIITNIHAGMGNQMFMYAAGLSAATKLNTELRLGMWNFRIHSPNPNPLARRLYSLGCFPGITERTATFSDLWKIYPGLAIVNALSFKFIQKHRICTKLLRRFLMLLRIYDGYDDFDRITKRELFSGPKYSRFYIQRPNYSHADFDDISDGVCMLGYWVSEIYFSGISDLVRKKFTFAPEYFRHESLRRIKSCNSVAIHVRRGDKVGRTTGGPSCSEAPWIKAAVQKISSLTENPSFFVFSDDIDWCKENLPKIYDAEYTFLDGNTEAQDMALMTKCRHMITSPSTFSWWAAWLNDSPGKIIIAPGPKSWVVGKTISCEHLPGSWILID